MKRKIKMKRFNQYISEGSKTTEGQVSADSDFSYGMGNLANPEVIERINAFLGVMGSMEHLVAEHAISKLRERLGRLHISFGDVDLSEGGGKVSLPISQYARSGKEENGDDISPDDDGISHKIEGGLSLQINHVKTESGTHFIKAKIV